MGIRRRGDHWIWVGGPVPPGSDALTISSLISIRRESADSPGLLRHEEEHVRQWRKLGPARFLYQYLGAYLSGRWRGFGHRAAYRMIPLEIEAEEASRRFMARRTCSGPGVTGAADGAPADRRDGDGEGSPS